MKIINASQVRQLLRMDECIDAMDRGQRAASRGNMIIPMRVFAQTPDGNLFGAKPGISPDPKCYGAKLISLHPDNAQQGLPAIQGGVLLFDYDTGSPVALLEAGEITAIRTAAASGMATRLLARGDAQTLGLFGYGVQARTHLEAMRCVRQIRTVLVSGRSPKRAEAFAAEQAAATGLDVRVASPEQTAACDIVCTVTSSPQPILQGDWLSPGAHVNLVGAFSPTTREADSATIARCAVFVELMEAALTEAGDLMIPISEGVIEKSHLRAEIGAVADGDAPGRESPEQITLYKSLGNVCQDLLASELTYRKANEQDLGVEVDLSA